MRRRRSPLHQSCHATLPTMNETMQFSYLTNKHDVCAKYSFKLSPFFPFMGQYTRVMEVFSYRALLPASFESNAQPVVLLSMETAKWTMDMSRGGG
jgi:hypothetical protein